MSKDELKPVFFVHQIYSRFIQRTEMIDIRCEKEQQTWLNLYHAWLNK